MAQAPATTAGATQAATAISAGVEVESDLNQFPQPLPSKPTLLYHCGACDRMATIDNVRRLEGQEGIAALRSLCCNAALVGKEPEV